MRLPLAREATEKTATQAIVAHVSVSLAHKRVRIQNTRYFFQAKLNSEINVFFSPKRAQ